MNGVRPRGRGDGLHDPQLHGSHEGGWDKHFICVPSFTVSSVSPGLQAADVIAHLGGHLADPRGRPEIQPFVARMLGLTYTFTRGGRSARRVKTARRVG
jgi:hypothetical protein